MIIVGVDEVGRGPLIGDVVAAAVVLHDPHNIPNLKDSKKLSERAREKLYEIIRDNAHDWYIASASHLEVDKLNILQASMLAMQRAVAGLTVVPDLVLVDGDKTPDLKYRSEAIIKGDSKIAAISAASIIAKVYRDRQMIELDKQYPMYGFAQHKGYPTKQHLAALEKYGALPQHRRSYAPVARILNLVPAG